MDSFEFLMWHMHVTHRYSNNCLKLSALEKIESTYSSVEFLFTNNFLQRCSE